jgi:hypothetical protein
MGYSNSRTLLTNTVKLLAHLLVSTVERNHGSHIEVRLAMCSLWEIYSLSILLILQTL